jgi:Immune inhibitor A peptidase M6
VKVWFQAGQKHTSDSFTYEAKEESSNKVLLMVAEDYTGPSADVPSPYAGPLYQDTYGKALSDAHVGYDVYDVDAENRTAPTTLGVLSHYKAVIWETGEDLYVRHPGQPGGTGVAKLLDDEIMATRDYMNDGGKLLVAGKFALQGSWDQFLYNPLPIPPAPDCASNQTTGQGALADDPPGQNFNCVVTSNDFQQYWLGAYLPITLSDDPDTIASFTLLKNQPLGTGSLTLNGADSAQNQDNLYSFLTTSSILPPDQYPQFKSDAVIKTDGPPAFDPKTGTHYAITGATSSSYQRLTRTVDLTSATAPTLSFSLSYDTEPNFDYVFVEAHTPGQDDWTTLPDMNGNTDTSTGAGCSDPDPFWLNENPFLRHYITRDASTTPPTCTPHGTSGDWNAATGNSAGYQDWKIDLSAYKGKQVELSITYVTDPASLGLGLFLDDVTIADGATTIATTSFEDGLGGWAVPGSPLRTGPTPTTGRSRPPSASSTVPASRPTTRSTGASASRA